MNYLIIYMSHHGTTQKVVDELKEKLGSEETSIINLEKDSVPDLSRFTRLVVRAKMRAAPAWAEWLAGTVLYPPAHGLMSAVQLKTIKQYAERDAQMRGNEKRSFATVSG